MKSERYWSEKEIDTLIEARAEGLTMEEIADLVDRSVKSCNNKMYRLLEKNPELWGVIGKRKKKPKKIVQTKPKKVVLPKKLVPKERKISPKPRKAIQRHSMCWLCQRAGRCKKPVNGWEAKIKESVNEGTLIIVKRCPEFIAEPWVDRMSDQELYHYYHNEEDL
jgi:hypothetical protein